MFFQVLQQRAAGAMTMHLGTPVVPDEYMM
jgi:hypothetical protein